MEATTSSVTFSGKNSECRENILFKTTEICTQKQIEIGNVLLRYVLIITYNIYIYIIYIYFYIILLILIY